MDIHRCRFVPYQPSAINALAFSHPRTRSAKHASLARLAVGRANGDIEIWNPLNGSWHQETIIRGGKDRSIDGLIWVNEVDQDLGDGRILVGKSRLFSIGYTSTVTEWDLEKGKPKRHASGQHGDIWCLAAQPGALPDKNNTNEAQTSNKLIAGTINGELVMYSVEDGDLQFQRVVVKSPTKKAQMVSITFQSRRVAIVGCSDGTIRAYDINSGHMIRRMTLGADLVGGSKDIIVWTVKCLPGGNIVSGDSTGQVCIWDGKTYTLTQRLQSHKQDVLSLAISADGTSIMSGAMDRRTVIHKRAAGSEHRWTKALGRRFHHHDVKAMASFESAKLSVVVSGGPDSNLVVVPLREVGRENHRIITNLPQQPPLISAPKSRFLVSWWEREVHIWILHKTANDLLENQITNINQNRKLLKTIVIKGDSNIASATINQDGTLLVVSTATDIKAFHLQHHDPVKPSDVTLSSVQLSPQLTTSGATQVLLSPDGMWLGLVQEGTQVYVVKVETGPNGTPPILTSTQSLRRISRNIPNWVVNSGLGRYDRTITHLAFSADSAMIAAGDLAGFIDTWVLQSSVHNAGKNEEPAASESDSSDLSDEEASTDSESYWIRNPQGKLLPKLPSAPVVLSFTEGQSHRQQAIAETVGNATAHDESSILLAITSSGNILSFFPRKGSLTPWARQHPRKALPAPIQDLLDLVKGVVWQGPRMWAYGVSFLFMLDLSQDLDETRRAGDASSSLQARNGIKRKRTGASSGAGGKMAVGNIVPHQVQRVVNGQWEDMELDDTPSRTDDSDSDAELEGRDAELTKLRNSTGAAQLSEQSGGDGERKAWWITHKYRPIFGIVPLDTTNASSLEVALVERPTWDVEMPDTYFGGEVWER
ncbi:hypothetical protein S40288_02419 [Stachybotrys chartarum IBT 40288]|nr:hypothetical protein S40288_02419 [Stachybotrys chartarum IBT 40288]